MFCARNVYGSFPKNGPPSFDEWSESAGHKEHPAGTHFLLGAAHTGMYDLFKRAGLFEQHTFPESKWENIAFQHFWGSALTKANYYARLGLETGQTRDFSLPECMIL